MAQWEYKEYWGEMATAMGLSPTRANHSNACLAMCQMIKNDRTGTELTAKAFEPKVGKALEGEGDVLTYPRGHRFFPNMASIAETALFIAYESDAPLEALGYLKGVTIPHGSETSFDTATAHFGGNADPRTGYNKECDLTFFYSDEVAVYPRFYLKGVEVDVRYCVIPSHIVPIVLWQQIEHTLISNAGIRPDLLLF